MCDPSAPSDPKANDAHYEKLDGRLNTLIWALIRTRAETRYQVQEKFEVLLNHIIGADDLPSSQVWQMVASIQADMYELVS